MSDNILDFPDMPPPEDGDGPRENAPQIDVFAALQDAWNRLVAVSANKAEKADLKRLEFDLLDKEFIDACALEQDRRAVIVAVAQLQTHSFTKSAQKVEAAITKRGLEIEKYRRTQAAKEDATRRAAFLRAAAERESDAKKWPVTRKGPHPMVEASLSRNKAGVRPTFSNVFKAIRDDPRWGPRLSVNRLGEVVELDSKPIESESLVTANLTEWLADTYDLHVQPDVSRGALFAAAEIRAHHPVRDYLSSLPVWDGTPVISRIVPEILGIKPGTSDEDVSRYNLYQRYILRTAIASVARVMCPGCKQDTALVLIGQQGAQKSSFFKVLYGAEFYGDSPIPIGTKDAPIQLRSTWCYECAEGASMSKKTADEVKQFLTIAADNFRHIYEKNARTWPRHTVIGVTVNKGQFLNDETGSRRFWPIEIPEKCRIDLRLLRKLRDAIWSEAMALYLRAAAAKEADELPGEDCRWWFEPNEDEARAADSDRFTVGDVWDAMVAEWVKGRQNFTLAEALIGAVDVPKERMAHTEESRMRRIVMRFGYRVKRQRFAGGYRDVWTSDATPEPTPPSAPLAAVPDDEPPSWITDDNGVPF